ncbi:MAG: hypothetical protein H6738_17715 [Alphaproteobacteria bacterium]|nr:hypothetical protein [Alphaproteobacteria bacterium]MCB9698623.1 hypothetical protein [Alphaproteobacteria bacterium]
MKRVLACVVALSLAGCPKQTPVEPAVVAPTPAAPVTLVDDAGDLAGVAGTVTVVGTVADEGGAVVRLDDGTALRVMAGGMPDGWDWLVGSRVRLLARPEQRADGWWLADAQTPMPADVGISLQ